MATYTSYGDIFLKGKFNFSRWTSSRVIRDLTNTICEKNLYIFTTAPMELSHRVLAHHEFDTIRNVLKKLQSCYQEFLFLPVGWAYQLSNGLSHLHRLRVGLGEELTLDSVLVDEHLDIKIMKQRNNWNRRTSLEVYHVGSRTQKRFEDRYQYGVLVLNIFIESRHDKEADRNSFKKLLSSARTRERNKSSLKRLLQSIRSPVKSDESKQTILSQLKTTIACAVKSTTRKSQVKRATMEDVSELWQTSDLLRCAMLDRDIAIGAFRSLASGNSYPRSDYSGLLTVRTTKVVDIQPKPEVVVRANRRSTVTVTNLPYCPLNFIPIVSSGGLSLSISEIGGEAQEFHSPSAVARQTIPASQGDEVMLLTRSYSSELVSDNPLNQLCDCSEFFQLRIGILSQLGSSVTEIDNGGEAPTRSNVEMLLKNLRDQTLLSVRDLALVLKKCGCLSGLRVLREFEDGRKF